MRAVLACLASAAATLALMDHSRRFPDRSPASDALVKAAVAYDEAAAEIRRALLAMGQA